MSSQIILSFIIGFFLYSFGAFLSNSDTMKSSNLYLPLAIGGGIIANFIWFSMARSIKNNSEILMLGFYWDVMIVFTFMLIPFLFFEVNLDIYKITGLFLIFGGIVLTKI